MTKTMTKTSMWVARISGWLLALALLAAAVLPAAATSAPALAPVDPQAVDAFITAMMQKHNVPGLSLVIIEDGQVAYTHAYGEAAAGRPMTTTTPMYIGSTSKTFTAVAIMQLVEAGRVDLDAPVRTYIPWFAVADETASQTITVRNLLNHASGLTDLTYNDENLPMDASIEDSVRAMKAAVPIHKPGKVWQYFNGNYHILGYIIEQVSGMSYADYIQTHIFDPLEMSHSYTEPLKARQNGLADAHMKMFGFPIATTQPYRRFALPAGYLISCSEDMGHFITMLSNGGNYGGKQILTQTSLMLMKADNQQVQGAGYGFAMFVDNYNGSTVLGHGGDNEYFHSDMNLLPDQKRAFSILTNQNNLVEAFITHAAIRMGMINLLMGTAPQTGGISVRVIGLVLLAVVLLVLFFEVRGMLGLRTWRKRAAAMSRGKLVFDIAINFILPTLIIIAVVYGMQSFMNRGVNLVSGFRNIPDFMTLSVVGTLPDYIQGICKLVMLAFARKPSAGVEQGV